MRNIICACSYKTGNSICTNSYSVNVSYKELEGGDKGRIQVLACGGVPV